MAFIDYYKIMGIPKDYPQADMRKAYTKRAKLFHPDLHPDDPKAKAKFQALSEAYAVLSDPEKRSKYDRYGEQWEHAEEFERAAGAGGADGGRFHFGGADGGGFDFSQFTGGGAGFSSFFNDLFGGGAAGHAAGGFGQARRDAALYDMQATVSIDLYTALLGGDILLQSQGGKLKLKVKPGTQNGSKIRLRGKGYQKPDGTYGHLIITYHVVLPESLTPRQQELLREMQKEG